MNLVKDGDVYIIRIPVIDYFQLKHNDKELGSILRLKRMVAFHLMQELKKLFRDKKKRGGKNDRLRETKGKDPSNAK